jgi:hypothetical protein
MREFFSTRNAYLAVVLYLIFNQKPSLNYQDHDGGIYFAFPFDPEMEKVSYKFYHHLLAIDPYAIAETAAGIFKEMRQLREDKKREKDASNKEVSND